MFLQEHLSRLRRRQLFAEGDIALPVNIAYSSCVQDKVKYLANENVETSILVHQDSISVSTSKLEAIFQHLRA